MKVSSNITLSTLPPKAAQLTAICVLAAALGACGGGSSGGEVVGGTDDTNTDTDIVPVGSFPVSDLDPDGDGLFTTEEEALGLNPNDPDSDLDGIEDGAEDFDGDGINNLDEAAAGTLLDTNDGGTPPDTTPPVASCADTSSVNFEWNDNCQLQNAGEFATSTYTQGVQRILFCAGFGTGTATTITGFADGIFGPNTDLAVTNYQSDRGLLVDGIVGPETWGELQNEIQIIADLSTDTQDAYSIIGCSNNITQFFNEVDGFLLGGWTLASEPGSFTTVPFSIDAP